MNNAYKACIIWMHGLGSNGKDMSLLAEHAPLKGLPIKHIFLDAPVRPVTINNGMRMPAWYDIYGATFDTQEDRDGILEANAKIMQAIQEAQKNGFESHQIILAGFSQGGAMALYTALHSELPLMGIIALSSYLPLAKAFAPKQARNIPIFMAAGQFDHVVLPAWSKQVANLLSLQSYQHMTLNEYPMEHSICLEELQDLGLWLKCVLEGEFA